MFKGIHCIILYSYQVLSSTRYEHRLMYCREYPDWLLHETFQQTEMQEAVDNGGPDSAQPIKSLLATEHIYMRHCLKKAASIIKDPNHSGHALFSLLPLGREY